MSNDITPSRLPPAAVSNTSVSKPVEPVRAQAVEGVQAAQTVKPAEIATATLKPNLRTTRKKVAVL